MKTIWALLLLAGATFSAADDVDDLIRRLASEDPDARLAVTAP